MRTIVEIRAYRRGQSSEILDFCNRILRFGFNWAPTFRPLRLYSLFISFFASGYPSENSFIQFLQWVFLLYCFRFPENPNNHNMDFALLLPTKCIFLSLSTLSVQSRASKREGETVVCFQTSFVACHC